MPTKVSLADTIFPEEARDIATIVAPVKLFTIYNQSVIVSRNNVTKWGKQTNCKAAARKIATCRGT